MSTKRTPTVVQFMKRFPDEAACLEHLKRIRYGERHACEKCGRDAAFYRVKSRRAYECEHCGYQVYPTAGTPFENTRTPLQDWFWVMFMFCTTRNGVAAKEVQRQLGVTYKTAWRMCNLIRQYMGYVDGDNRIGGGGGGAPVVEIDHAYIGGHDKEGEGDKAIVLGMAERGGDVVTRHIPDRTRKSVVPHLLTWVRHGSRLMSDDERVFNVPELEAYYRRGIINHSAGEYVRGDIHTNTIETFWGVVKRSINGTYIHVSKKWLQTYLSEAEFRHNLRKQPHLMFDLLLQAFPRPGEAHPITSPTIKRRISEPPF
jgi:transposase